MDVIVPGGVTCDIDDTQAHAMRAQAAALAKEVKLLQDIYDDHAGLQDRIRGCGEVSGELAVKLGLVGLAARGSGVADDLRCDFPAPPYDTLAVRAVAHPGGDVAARIAVRFHEIFESLRLIDALLTSRPDGVLRSKLPDLPAFRLAIGAIEGWRGPVLVALETGPEGSIHRCHPHDPSWQNWPLLEYAVIGNIVPDFPLINKSFNLSYSGHDL